jgi:dihydrolipoamide dehydrogenase
MERFDLVVIGAGPSGYAAAMRALDFKKRVLLIEKNNIGGAGVTNGALSSKTWWELSREAAVFRKNLKRYNIDAPSISYNEIQSEVLKAVQERKDMLEEHMHELKKSSYADLLTFKTGEAKLLNHHEIEINSVGKKGSGLCRKYYFGHR